MTAIGALVLEGFPLLIGDIAVSSDSPPLEDVAVPTIRDTRHIYEEGAKRFIWGSRQKVVVYHDRLAVAWSGSLDAAYGVLRKLSELASPTRGAISEIVRGQDPSALTKDGLTLLGFLMGDGAGHIFRTAGQTISWSRQGEHFAGRGGEHLRSVLKHGLSIAQASDTSVRGAARAAVAGGLLAGHMMAEDFVTPQWLREGFGGCYEAATWADGRFQKIDETVHIFFPVFVEGDGVAIRGARVLRKRYHESWLVVRAATIESIGKPPFDDEHTVIVGPHQSRLDAPTFIEGRDAASFEAPWICTHAIIVKDGVVHAVIDRVDVGAVGAVSVEDDGKIEVHEAYMTALMQQIRLTLSP